jgi:hypothetical protein
VGLYDHPDPASDQKPSDAEKIFVVLPSVEEKGSAEDDGEEREDLRKMLTDECFMVGEIQPLQEFRRFVYHGLAQGVSATAQVDLRVLFLVE